MHAYGLFGGKSRRSNQSKAKAIAMRDMMDPQGSNCIHHSVVAATITRTAESHRTASVTRREVVVPHCGPSHALRGFRRILGSGVELAMQRSDDLWTLAADPSQLELTVTNLTTNACDAMPSGGRLTIETANVHLEEHDATGNTEIQPGD
jgi:hypothetical protein